MVLRRSCGSWCDVGHWKTKLIRGEAAEGRERTAHIKGVTLAGAQLNIP